MSTREVVCAISMLAVFAGCAGAPPQKEFDSGRKVQTIAVSKHGYIFAQDDILLDDSLDKKLSTMNATWKDDLTRASTYQGLAVAAFIGQLASLVICAGQNNTANIIAWCGGSVALGLGAVVPLSIKGEDIRFGVVNQFNQQLH